MADDVLGWHVKHLHDASELFDFVLSREDRIAGVQLGQDATYTSGDEDTPSVKKTIQKRSISINTL